MALAGKVGTEEKAKIDLSDLQAMSDPSSNASQIYRATAAKILGADKDPQRAKMIEGMSGLQLKATLGKDLGSLIEQEANRDLQREQRKLINEERMSLAQNQKEAKEEKRQQKLDDNDTKRLDTANKLISSAVASGRGAFGIAAKNLQSIQNVQALLDGQDLDSIDNRQLTETARVLDRVLSQGSPTISGTEHLTPDTARMKIASLMEKYGNRRVGAGAGDFLKTIMHTFDKEQRTAKKQILNAQHELLGSYEDIAKKNPDAWKTLLIRHDIDPSFYDEEAQLPSKAKDETREPASKVVGHYPPGTVLKVKGKSYRVGADGDSLEEI